MSHSSYTASERRGIILIALLVLLLIASGIVLSLCGRPREKTEEIPVVVHQEFVDSSASITRNKAKSKKKRKSEATKLPHEKQKPQKTYRRRSPLDEPVGRITAEK